MTTRKQEMLAYLKIICTFSQVDQLLASCRTLSSIEANRNNFVTFNTYSYAPIFIAFIALKDTYLNILNIQGVFFNWDPPKSSKYQIT